MLSLRLKVILVVAVTALAPVFMHCAHPVAPTGGPKDVTPPMVMECSPENYTARFAAKKIVIDFDEYIVLKDQAKEIFTSPPMVVKPVYTVRGKSLVVEFQEELRTDATYVIFFGNAITDLTEGNPLTGFTYVFSTGEVIDSMLIAGRVLAAVDLKPVENILVTVYAAGQDTIPLDSMPLSIPPMSATRTDAEGKFMLTNLPDKDFLLFALEDLNNNFYYDLPDEKIAFLDSLVRPEWVPTVRDTSELDSLDRQVVMETTQPSNAFHLYLFTEEDSTQRLLSSAFTPLGSIQLAFRMPADSLVIEPLNFPAGAGWMMEEQSLNRDTLVIWPKDAERDTFRLRVALTPGIDDTLRLIRKRTDVSGGRKRPVTAKSLEYRSSAKGGILEPEKEYYLLFSEPLVSPVPDSIWLTDGTDTLLVQATFADSIRRKLLIHYPWHENGQYQLSIPDSVLTGLSGKMNDAILLTIRTKPYTDYGTLLMDYGMPKGNRPFIVELLAEKDVVIQRDTIASPSRITYRFLKPGSYRIKAISDRNGNGRWDTGNYDRKELPERVTYFEEEITVRSNWEIQEEWNLLP